MANVSQFHQDQLTRIKKNIVDSYVYFEKNRDYFNKMRNFVFNTTLSDGQRAALQELNRPEIEFNVVEAFISRLLGEFSKQLPGVSVHAQPTVSIPPQETIKLVQGHMRSLLSELNANEIYKDQLSGGFSCMKVFTEFEHEKSCKQKITFKRVYDPLLCGFDPCAQESHKGDGSYCFEIIPITEEQFRAMYGDSIKLDGCFKGSLGGFKWGYKSNRKNIIMLCDYYEKRSRRVRLYELPGGMCVTKDEYNQMLDMYVQNNDIAQPPEPVNKRWTILPQIDRYRIISTQVIEHDETDYERLPLIFVDGNSVTLRKDGDGSTIEQVTRSYIHNAVGAQKLKNLAGQTLANHIENLVDHKFSIAMESIPIGQEEAYTNPQISSNLLYNQYSEDGERQYNPPQPVQKIPLPPEIVNTYMSAEQTIQAALGSYDASLGINKNQLSGVAIVEGATQSNAAAMPFVVNYLASLQQAASLILELIPKYYVTERTIPVLTNEDKKEFVTVNSKDPSSPQMKFNSKDLKVQVNAGVNFEVQKNRSVQMLIELSNALPGMAQLINNPKGLAILADNLSIKGADQIKSLAEEAIKQQESQSNQPPPPNPQMVDLSIKQQALAQKQQTDQALIAIKNKEANAKILSAAGDMSEAKLKYSLQAERDDTERMVHGINLHIKNKQADAQISKTALGAATNLISTVHKTKQSPQNVSSDFSGITGQSQPQAQMIPEGNQ